MAEHHGERSALAASLALHFILFILAAFLGLFSVVSPAEKQPPFDVLLYDAGIGAETGSADAASPAPASASVDDFVLRDKTLVQPQEQETPQQRPMRTVQERANGSQTEAAQRSGAQGGGHGSAAAGTGSGSSTGSGEGAGGHGAAGPPAPPRERVAASLRAEAIPEYPKELVDENIEGAVSIRILVAADGSIEDVSVISSSGFRAMDRAAIAAARRFQFNPGDDGQRGVWTKTFRFQLQ